MKVFLVAGEPSGDRLGAALMAGLKQLVPGVEFRGIGGQGMEEAGLNSLFPMSELSVMGLAEILPKYFELKRRVTETAQAVAEWSPDVLITIDIPEFSLRVAKAVRTLAPNLHNVHYVAPTVWAWRAGRAAKMAPSVDQVLALLPFEPPYMQAEGMRCDFVGHPVVTEPQASPAEAAQFRARHDIAPDAPLILALPGSRRGEVARLAPIFGAALAEVVQARPGARVVLPTVAATAGPVTELTADWPVPPLLLDPRDQSREAALAEKRAAFAAADVALAASGTVSLELAAADTPMVIAYDMAWLSRVLISRMLTVDTVTLVNLVAESRTIPEFIGKACQPGPIATAVQRVLDAPDEQRAAMALSMERLGRNQDPPGLRAARAVLEALAAKGRA